MHVKVLHIEDDPIIADAVRTALEGNDRFPLTVETVTDAATANTALKNGVKDLVLLDLHLSATPGAEGLDILQNLKQQQLPVIVYSSDMSLIKSTMRYGADDFIFKSPRMDEFVLRVLHFLETRSLARSSNRSASQFSGQTMRDISARIQKIVHSSVRSIFVMGETGTGKEVVADLLESALPSGVPFVRLNCAAIAPTLIESELFGHVKGAFTGAQRDRRGFFATAQNGWLFLDEITCLPETTQAKLLRAIENQEISRVGETATRKVNVKIIAASNEPIEEMLEKKSFRADLWNRVNEIVIELPPLRNRKEEIPVIIDSLLAKEDGGPYTIASEAKTLLQQAQWRKGNVRELRSCLRAMTAYPVDKMLVPAGIPDWFWEELKDEGESSADDQPLAPRNFAIDFSQGYEYATEALLISMIKEFASQPGSHSLRKMADRLKLPKSTLANKIRKAIDHGIVTEAELKKVWPK